MHACRWLYSVADDFFTKQLPHNVTWGLTVLYALDASKDLTSVSAQVSIIQEGLEIELLIKNALDVWRLLEYCRS